MKDYKDLIVHKFDRDVVVYPISDVHFGSMGHNEKAWNEFVKYSKRNIRNEYFTERIKFNIYPENACLIEREE